MQYIIDFFIVLGIIIVTTIVLGIIIVTTMMLCGMENSTDRERDDAEQLKWIHQLSEEKRSECKSDT